MEHKKLKWDAKLYQENSQWQFDLGLMAIDRLLPVDGEDILDIGCGNAMTTIEIAKKIPNGTITAIELSKEMIEQAEMNLSKFNINNVNILHMNALNIKFREKFDAVISNSVIHWIIDLESMYKLIHAALKHNGRIIIQNGLKEINLLFKLLYEIKRLPEFEIFFKNMRFPWRFLSIKETYSMFEKIGFNHVNIEVYKYNRIFSDIDKLIDYSKAAALLPYLNLLPNELIDDFIKKYEEIVLRLVPSNDIKLEMTRVFNFAKK